MTTKKQNGPQQHSLFVGRWQPFHKGHKTLIETVLKQGKPVIIAIRDTEISKQNPLSVTERWTLIQKELQKYINQGLVKIVTMPDIDEICYGREVGYNIRRIHLDREIEDGVSGTKIREKMIKHHPIFWLTGQSGSGKSTLAKRMQKKVGGVVLDGDQMRQSISLNAGFGQADRHEHNLRVARLAAVLSRDNVVWVSVIAPFRDTRKEITKMIDPVWVYVERKLPRVKHKPYEVPKKPQIKVNTDRQSLKENIDILVKKTAKWL